MLKGAATVLVTGATGFIGSALVHRLSAESVTTVCLIRKASARRHKLDQLPNVEILNYEYGSLGRQLASVKPDAIFNLASAGVNPAERDPELLVSGNLGLLVELLHATAAKPPRSFVHVGSCSEYGKAETGRLICENDCLLPTSLYGAAKACSHIYGSALAAQYGIRFVTMRLFSVFGSGEACYRLVPQVISRLSKNHPVELTAGEQIRDLIYVDDAVEALLQAAQSEGLRSSCAYNVCSGQAVKIRHVAECVAEVMGKPKRLLHFGALPYRSDESMWMVGNNQRFTELTGWSPQITLQEGIRCMIRQVS